MKISRRQFIGAAIAAGAATLGFAGLRRFWDRRIPGIGYGELVQDPNNLLDLPKGFRYHVLSRTGDPTSDGLLVPGAPDGMAAFRGSGGRTILIRNHELSADSLERSAFGPENAVPEWLDPALIYDASGGLGGTTTLVYDTTRQKLERQYLSLIGTVRNCAGGSTPWGSWVSSEESVARPDEKYTCDHGFNFEVPANAGGLVKPVPLKAMGRFNHEAICVDAATGIVYETEDRGDGLFYRFLPNVNGNLAAGGRLQALRIGEESVDTSNHETLTVLPRSPLQVTWIDLEEVESPEDDLRERGAQQGAALFARGEGIWADRDCIYFAATSGGFLECGQIWKYVPSTSTLELFAESPSSVLLENPDNISIAPWGDLLICEDGPFDNRMIGITPGGRYYTLARNVLNDSELTGGVFSPDGSTLFINIQSPGITFAITGPWRG